MLMARIEDAPRHRAPLPVLLGTQGRMMLLTVLAHPKRLITNTVKKLLMIPQRAFLMNTTRLHRRIRDRIAIRINIFRDR